jgi:hypothetical protein
LTTRPILILILIRLLSIRIKRPPPSPRLTIQILNKLEIIFGSRTRFCVPILLFLLLIFFFLFVFIFELIFLRLIPIYICPSTSISGSRDSTVLPITLHPLGRVVSHLHIAIAIASSNTGDVSLSIGSGAVLGLLGLALAGFDIGVCFQFLLETAAEGIKF